MEVLGEDEVGDAEELVVALLFVVCMGEGGRKGADEESWKERMTRTEGEVGHYKQRTYPVAALLRT